MVAINPATSICKLNVDVVNTPNQRLSFSDNIGM